MHALDGCSRTRWTPIIQMFLSFTRGRCASARAWRLRGAERAQVRRAIGRALFEINLRRLRRGAACASVTSLHASCAGRGVSHVIRSPTTAPPLLQLQQRRQRVQHTITNVAEYNNIKSSKRAASTFVASHTHHQTSTSADQTNKISNSPRRSRRALTAAP